MKAPKFRLQGQGFFLTYPHCAIEKEWALEHLMSLAETDKAIVAREDHKEKDEHGEAIPHLHVFIKYKKKL